MKRGILTLLLIVLIAGCTAEQKDLKEIVKEIPEVKAFLVEHPSAVLGVSLVPQGQIVSQIETVKNYCQQMTLGSYYKVTAVDIGSRKTFTAWIDSRDYSFVCSNMVSPTTSTTQTVASTTTSQETTITVAPTTTIEQLTTTTIAATTTTSANQTNITSANNTTTTTLAGSTTTAGATTTTNPPTTTAPTTTTSSSTTTTTLPQNIFGRSDCTGGSPGGGGGLAADGKGVSKFTLLTSSTISKLIIYVDGKGTGSGSQVMKGIVYADSGGNPQVLKATTNEVTVLKDQTAGWVALTFPSTVDLNGGDYWLGIINGQNPQVMRRYNYTTQTTGLATRGDVYSDGASDPFGTPSFFNVQMCIYATNA